MRGTDEDEGVQRRAGRQQERGTTPKSNNFPAYTKVLMICAKKRFCFARGSTETFRISRGAGEKRGRDRGRALAEAGSQAGLDCKGAENRISIPVLATQLALAVLSS